MQRAVERFFQLSLLGLVASGFLAVAGSGFLDLPTVILVCLGLALRAVSVAGLVHLSLPDAAVNFLTLAYIGFFAADYFLISRGLLEATVHLVCFLAVMKVLTARTDRDYVYTAAVALVELVAAAMLSVNLNFFAYLAVYLIFAIAAATSAEIRRGLKKAGGVANAKTLRVAPRLAALTAFIGTGVLLLTLALFIVLPRSANAAFRHMFTARHRLSGFSNEVMLGEIGEIQKDHRTVMHVRPYSQFMPANLKWRGAALSHFDGRKWSDTAWLAREVLPRKSPVELAGLAQRSRRDGARFSYRVDLNPSDSDALFVAGTPEFLNLSAGRVVRTATGSLRFAGVPGENLRYEVSSFLARPGSPVPTAHLTLAEAQRYLQLPALDPRVALLARQLGNPSAIERYLRTQFGYTLELPQNYQADPLGNFLFERRRGHCEYFASAMTVMLRTLDIPARVVNGFQSGTFNPISGLYVIRASDAHSWVEAWSPKGGWAVYDPTPYVPRPALSPLGSRIGFYLDAAETFWQEWVVNYDLNHQITIAERLQETTQEVSANWKPDFHWQPALLVKTLPEIAAAVLALLLLPTAFRALRRRTGRATHADASALYRRMLRQLKKRGYEKPPFLTAAEFAGTLPPSPLALAVGEFTRAYQSFRYGDDAAAIHKLDALLDRMRTL